MHHNVSSSCLPSVNKLLWLIDLWVLSLRAVPDTSFNLSSPESGAWNFELLLEFRAGEREWGEKSEPERDITRKRMCCLTGDCIVLSVTYWWISPRLSSKTPYVNNCFSVRSKLRRRKCINCLLGHSIDLLSHWFNHRVFIHIHLACACVDTEGPSMSPASVWTKDLQV